MKKRWISVILILLITFNTTVFAIGTEIDELSNQIDTMTLDEMIGAYSTYNDSGVLPDDRFDLGMKMVGKMVVDSNSDYYLEQLSDIAYSNATGYQNILDYNFGLYVAGLFNSAELKDLYTQKFEDARLDFLGEDFFDEPKYDNVKGETDYVVSNPINGNTGNNTGSSNTSNGSSSSDEFPSDAVYSRIEYIEENGAYYKVTNYFDPNGEIIKTSKVDVTATYTPPESDNYNNGNSYDNGNISSGNGDYETEQPGYSDEYSSETLSIYNERGDLIAIEVGEEEYVLNTYVLYYSKDKYKSNPQYQNLGVTVVGEEISYTQLSNMFENIANRKLAYFVEENDEFTAIIDGSTYHFTVNDTMTIEKFKELFYEVDFTVKTRVKESVKFDKENREGILTEITSTEFKSEKQYEFTIDGLAISNNSLVNHDSVLLFPIKSLAEGLGYEIYESDTELTLNKGENKIIYKLNENTITKNGTEYTLSSKTIKGATGEYYGVFDLEVFELDYNSSIDSLNGVVTVQFTN